MVINRSKTDIRETDIGISQPRNGFPGGTVQALAEAAAPILIAIGIILILASAVAGPSHGAGFDGTTARGESGGPERPIFAIEIRQGAIAANGDVTMAEAFEIEAADPEVAANVAGVVLSTAAAPGRTRKIEPAVVYYRLRLAGFHAGTYRWDEPSTLSISTPSRTIGAEEIEKAVRGKLASALIGMDYEADILGKIRDLVIEDTDYLFEVSEPDIRSCGYNTMKVRITGSGGEAITSVTLRVSLKFFATALVAAREIGLNETVGRDAFVTERIMVNPATEDTVSDPGLLEGLVAGRRIGKGTAVRRHMFERPLLVTGNSDITVTAADGGISVSMICRALGPGSAGDVIRVMNPSTRKVFSARVTTRAAAEAVN